MGEGNIHHLENLILSRFISQDAYVKSCLGRIMKGVRCCVKPRLILGEGLTLKHYRAETYVSRKWDPHLPKKRFYSRKGG